MYKTEITHLPDGRILITLIKIMDELNEDVVKDTALFINEFNMFGRFKQWMLERGYDEETIDEEFEKIESL